MTNNHDVSVVLELLNERGAVSKAEIDALIAPGGDAYRELQRELLSRPRMQLGPRKVGGFVLRPVPQAVPPATEQAATLFPWEADGVAKIAETLTYDDLEEMLGSRLVWTMRKVRRELSGEDRRSTKDELATALIIQHGRQLLQDSDIRERLVKRLKPKFATEGKTVPDNPGRWHPGKGSAARFVAAVGLPKEFIGEPAPEKKLDFEYLEGKVTLKDLAPFQLEVMDKALGVVSTPGAKAMVTLPTGAGKTRTAVETLRRWLTTRHAAQPDHQRQVILWLAHTEELCEQAYTSFKQVWESTADVCPLSLFRFWGNYTRDLVAHQEDLKQAFSTPAAFISTPQRIANLIAEKAPGADVAMAGLRNAAGVVVVDEAHRAAAPTYAKILGLFTLGPSILGLTATPYRMEYVAGAESTDELVRLFGGQLIEPESLGQHPRETLQAQGILAQPILETIKTRTSLSLPPGAYTGEDNEQAIERIDYRLKLDADRAQRRVLVLRRVIEICEGHPDNSVIYFGPTVEDATQMAFLLRQHRITSAAVSALTREGTRRQLIDDFKRGRIQVLCNCEVLTTGFDAPRVTHVVVARPTVSQVLFEQMVGRGLRGPKFGGTAHCTIVNCDDDYRETRPQLGWVGWRQTWKPQENGRQPSEA